MDCCVCRDSSASRTGKTSSRTQASHSFRLSVTWCRLQRPRVIRMVRSKERVHSALQVARRSRAWSTPRSWHVRRQICTNTHEWPTRCPSMLYRVSKLSLIHQPTGVHLATCLENGGQCAAAPFRDHHMLYLYPARTARKVPPSCSEQTQALASNSSPQD